jgi:hypothetical protein
MFRCSDGGKKVDEQHVACGEIELDRDVGREKDQGEQHREQQPAGDRFRNAEVAQETNVVVQPLADEQDDDADRHGQERLDPQNTVQELHRATSGLS